MKHSGFSKFINDFSLTLVGRTSGGPAKVAVIASGLMGMINGSAIANVATTGTITIPLMKRTGYKPALSKPWHRQAVSSPRRSWARSASSWRNF